MTSPETFDLSDLANQLQTYGGQVQCKWPLLQVTLIVVRVNGRISSGRRVKSAVCVLTLSLGRNLRLPVVQ